MNLEWEREYQEPAEALEDEQSDVFIDEYDPRDVAEELAEADDDFSDLEADEPNETVLHLYGDGFPELTEREEHVSYTRWDDELGEEVVVGCNKGCCGTAHERGPSKAAFLLGVLAGLLGR